MWVLFALQLMAGSSTARSSLPIVYTGVTMQEFSSEQSCRDAIKLIKKMNDNRKNGSPTTEIRDGIVDMDCKEK